MPVAVPVVDHTMTRSHASTARSGTSGDVWRRAARGGFAVSGLVHVILGYLIVRLAFDGDSGGETDSGAALSGLGESPAGGGVLWLAVAAWFALGAWCLVDAARPGADLKERAVDAGKAIVYAALALSAVSLVSGSSGPSSDSQAQGFAGSLMSAPAGRVLVAAVGAALGAGGAFLIHKGITTKFAEDLARAPRPVIATGRVGYPAKGVALGVVGILFLYAALTADAEKAEGLDGAIDSLLAAPAGPIIVGAVGVGFAAYGLYSFGRARFARM